MRIAGSLTASTMAAAILALGAAARAQTPPPPAPPVTSPPPLAAPPAPVEAQPAAPPAAEAPPADTYRPLLAYRFRGMEIAAPISFIGRVEGVKGFPVDNDGNTFQNGPAISPQVRLGLRFRSVEPLAGKFMFLAEYEHDVLTGTWTKDTPIEGVGLPNSNGLTHQLRKGMARFSVGPYLTIGGGAVTNHWGMGLIANDGAHGWEPGSARFTDPRGGDLVLRGFIATGPLTSARLLATFAVDKVRNDDVLLQGDSAFQFIASALIGYERPSQIGYFFVHRRQTTADGSALNVTVADVAGKHTFEFSKSKLTLEAEGAVIFGRTTIGASVDIPRSDVIQLGGALRASLEYARMGGVLDVLYASGDSNAYDAKVTGFKTDPNFETGLLLYRYVQAAQSGRASTRASDPMLSANPPPGVERVPTRGGITNTLAIFPRIWVRPARGLEAYGGVLFAIAPEKNADPLNTNLAGGSPRNALNASPGNYWGTELDLGVRYRLYLRGTELSAGAEGGVLFPGSALKGAPTPDFGPMFGGRFMLGYRL